MPDKVSPELGAVSGSSLDPFAGVTSDVDADDNVPADNVPDDDDDDDDEEALVDLPAAVARRL